MARPFQSGALLRRTQLALFLVVSLGWLAALSLGLGAWLDPERSGLIVGPVILLALVVISTVLTQRLVRLPGRWPPVALGVAGLIAGLAVGASVASAMPGVSTWADFWREWATSTYSIHVVGAAVVAVIAWWRGIVAGRSGLTLDEVIGASRGATFVLVGIFLLNALAGNVNAAPVAPLVGATLVVLFASLVGIPLARVRDVAASQRNAGQETLALNRYWLGMLLGSVAALLVVAILLALLLTFDRIDQVLALIGGPLGAVLDAVFYVVVVPVAFLVQVLFDLVQRFLHPGKLPPRSTSLDGGFVEQLHKQAQSGGGASPTFLLVTEVIAAVVIAGAVLWLLTRAARRYTQSIAEEAVAEERDFVWSWEEFQSLVRDWLRRLWNRRKAFRRDHGVAPDPATLAAPSRHAPRDPRSLYRELLWLGARLGRARTPSETPREYERDLAQLSALRDGEAEIATLTDVYAAARYGDVPPEEARVAAAVEALERLREMGEGN